MAGWKLHVNNRTDDLDDVSIRENLGIHSH
jgi:hypothetical protein